jgi:probable HAF family extracellular repeat protein
VQNIGELPTLGPHHTIPYSINNSGQVVGTSTNSDRAFLWTAEAGIWDLNDLLDASGSGWTLSVAFDINDHGQIVGSGIHNGVGHAFLLTPIDTPPPPQPILSVTPTSLDFDTIAVGSSKDLDLTVQNTGGGTLEGSCSTDAPFSLPDGCSFSVLAGQSQEVKVRFSPTAAGIFMGEVNFTSNGGTASPTIIGTAEPALVPAVALSSTRLTFGDQTIGSTSAPQTVTLTSSGTADLVLGILSLEGANPSDYVLSNNTCASATLPPGADCTFDVAFSPTAAGARTAAVNIVSNAANSPHPATLTGMGIIDICQANIDDSDFERAFPKIKKYLKRVFKVANVSQDVLEAITWGEFEGTPLWKILIFAITVEEFLKQADRPIDKINHELILVELATFTSEWGFTFLLSRLGSSFAGVASWASLGVLPITSSLERFVRDVKKIALTNQVKLHHLARNAGCSQESLLNRQDNCPDATLSFTDDGWLNAVTTTSQGTLRCGFLQACYPRPLTPSEVYGYAETLWLRPLSEVKADYLEDKVQIGNILRERIVQCSK